ncbi:MAG TPA: regulatory protein RecX [Lachnospiraceae bacterium]|nr:regulatory protein RecX [Lachnospiraceae bacterium]
MDYQEHSRPYRQSRTQQGRPDQNRQEPQNSQLKKAKIKALRLLERMDRTESQLRGKLLDAEFSPEITEQAIAYVKSFGYLDDERYVRNYIEYRSQSKSRRQLEQELQFRKGVSRELIQKIYEEMEPSDERSIIRHHLDKKHYDPETCDEKQRQKLIASLLRKGFKMADILSVLNQH